MYCVIAYLQLRLTICNTEVFWGGGGEQETYVPEQDELTSFVLPSINTIIVCQTIDNTFITNHPRCQITMDTVICCHFTIILSQQILQLNRALYHLENYLN